MDFDFFHLGKSVKVSRRLALQEVKNQCTRQIVGDWVEGVFPKVSMSFIRLGIGGALNPTILINYTQFSVPGWSPSTSSFLDHCWPFLHFLPQFIVPAISAIAAIRLNDSRNAVKKYYLHPKMRGGWRDRKPLFLSQALQRRLIISPWIHCVTRSRNHFLISTPEL